MTQTRIFICLWLLIAAIGLFCAIAQHKEIIPPRHDIFFTADPDPLVRMTQVRQWMQGGNFFSHAITNINASASTVTTHWTRPMDVLIAFSTVLVPATYSLSERIMIASCYLPVLLGLLSLFFLMKAARRPYLDALICLILMSVLNPAVVTHFMPQDVDHHGLLATIWCGALWMISLPQTKKTMMILGGLLGLLLWVSTEALLPIAFIYIALLVNSHNRQTEVKNIFYLSILLTAVTILGLVIEMPPQQYLTQITYDSLSIVHVAFFLFISAGTAGLSWLVHPRRFPSAALPFALSATILYGFLLYPLSRVSSAFSVTGFLIVKDMTPLWQYFTEEIRTPLLIVFPFIIATLVLYGAWREDSPSPDKKRHFRMMALLLGLTFIFCALHVRWAYYLHPVALLVIAQYLPGILARPRPLLFPVLKYVAEKWRPVLFLGGGTIALCLLLAVTAPHSLPVQSSRAACDSRVIAMIQSGQLEEILGKKPLILAGTESYSGSLLFFTPYRMMATLFHRETDGLRDFQEMVMARTPPAAKPVLLRRQVDILFYCPEDFAVQSWLHQLPKQQPPHWLTPLRYEKKTADAPLIYRVRH